ncbi:MAG: DASS family sodium-coupled anion symporter [Verrucomicrobiae bacterium]|nr:DASS family sodium-coupled anion symporter [Verrucomicrobiae bacterium]
MEDVAGDNKQAAPSGFDYWRRRLGLFLGPAALVLVYCLPMPGVSVEAHKLAAIMALTLTYWFCEAIPLAATALLGPALCIVLGVADEGKVLAPFASPVTFLFIGSFMLAKAMEVHGLDRRVALNVLSLPLVARSPVILVAAMGVMTAVLSMWMSNSATTAMMTPIALGVLRANPHFSSSDRAKADLLLMIAFAASVGGLATPVGTPTNLVAIGFVHQLVGVKITFLQWMQLALPLTAALMLFLVWQMRPPAGARFENHRALTEDFRRQRRALGPHRWGEWNTEIAFVCAVVLWTYPGLIELVFGEKRFGAASIAARFPEATVALVAALLLFVLPTKLRPLEFTMSWHDAARIDWGTILLFGGGLALGKQILDTGLAKAFGEMVNGLLGSPGLWTIMVVAIVFALVLTETTSNVAAANVMVPMMIGVAQVAGVNPVPVTVATCLACSFAFMLPVATPPNAIVYGTGLVPMWRMVRQGVALDIAGAIAVLLVMWLIAPALGWK